MSTDKHLQIFQEKIYELNTALFASHSDAVLKISTCVVSVLNVDDVGQLWFFIPKPRQSINEFEKTFISKVDFFRKGKNFFVEILGMAYTVTDPEEINGLIDFDNEIKNKAMHDSVLVKVRLLHVHYHESKQHAPVNTVKKIKETIHKILFNRPDYRPYYVVSDTLAY